VTGRAHCYICDKVASQCLCDRVSRVRNRTPITIVQHPRERRHPLGTVRIARLGLDRVEVHVTRPGAPAPRIPEGARVLFPDRDAPLLEALDPEVRLPHLVVIDGTWEQASQLRRHHPALAALPAVRLAPDGPSRYRVRREPNAQAVSTIEAIVRALAILEPETDGLDGLLESFDAMIDQHLEARAEHPYTPRHPRTRRRPKPPPEVLRDARAPLVLVHAEIHQPRGQASRFPLRVVAARPTPRQVVDALVQSPVPPSPARWINMEIGPPGDAPTLPPSEVSRRLAALIGPGDTLVGWPQSVAPVLRALGFTQPYVSAKRHWARGRGERVGSIDEVVASLCGAPLEPWAPGRAGRQLAELDRIVAALRARDDDTEPMADSRSA